MIRRSPGRERVSAPTTTRSGWDLTECATCGAPMRWDPHADEYVGVDGRYCPAASDAEVTLPHEARLPEACVDCHGPLDSDNDVLCAACATDRADEAGSWLDACRAVR